MSQTTQEILDERAKTHGAFKDHAAITQSLKITIRTMPGWNRCTAEQQEALEMVLHKIGRIIAGNPNHEDHWADMAGYSELGRKACAE